MDVVRLPDIVRESTRFVNILSISVLDLDVILVGLVITGRRELAHIDSRNVFVLLSVS